MTEQITEIDTLVVGAGQAGVAMSEHLTHHGIPHLVLEKKRIAEAWRSGRWDSLVANGLSRLRRRQLCRQRADRRLLRRVCQNL